MDNEFALQEALLRQPKEVRRKLLDAMGPEGIVLKDNGRVKVTLQIVAPPPSERPSA